jgi:protein SCO1/2
MKRVVIFVVTLACAVLPVLLWAQGETIHHHRPAVPADSGNQQVTVSGLSIPDVVLIDQNGKKVHFISDLVRGKVVAINTIFTTCTTICPLMGANFSKLSRCIPDKSRGKLNLISISIDPLEDTPQRLKQWSSTFGQSGAAWTLLTGAKPDIDRLLKALQVFTADKQDHAPVVLIGGEGAETWSRASALLPPAGLAGLIQTQLASLSITEN